MRLSFTILGQVPSMKNRRQLVTVDKGQDTERRLFIKSPEALAYEKDALRQVPPRCRLRLEGPLRMRLVLYYRSQRPDMDEQLLLDILQDRWSRTKPSNPIVPSQRVLLQSGVYRNDRQVVERHTYKRFDAGNPRAEVTIWQLLVADQQALALPAVVDEDDPFA